MGRKGGMEGRRRETASGVGGDTNELVLFNFFGFVFNFVFDWSV